MKTVVKNKIEYVFEYLVLIISNFVPLFGIKLFNWSITEALLYYCAEVCIYEIIIIPKVWIYCYKSDYYSVSTRTGRFFAAVGWNVYNFILLWIILGLLISFAYMEVPGKYAINKNTILIFLKTNYAAFIILLVDYIYHFYRDYFVQKLNYSKREGSDFFEIIIFPAMITLLLAFFAAFERFVMDMKGEDFQFKLIISVLVIKLITQIVIKNRKYIKKDAFYTE